MAEGDSYRLSGMLVRDFEERNSYRLRRRAVVLRNLMTFGMWKPSVYHSQCPMANHRHLVVYNVLNVLHL